MASHDRRGLAAPMEFEYQTPRSAPAHSFATGSGQPEVVRAESAASAPVSRSLPAITTTATLAGAKTAGRVSSPSPRDSSAHASADRPESGGHDSTTQAERTDNESSAVSHTVRPGARSSSRERVRRGTRRSRNSSPFNARYSRTGSRKQRGARWLPGLDAFTADTVKRTGWSISVALRLGLFLLVVYLLYTSLETLRTDVQRKDPSDFGRARIAAEAFAEIIEAFMQPLSMRTVFTFVVSTFGALALLNIVYTLYLRQHTLSDHRYGAPNAAYAMHNSQMIGSGPRNLRVQEVWHEMVEEVDHLHPEDDSSDSEREDRRGRDARRRRRRSRRRHTRSRSRSRTTVRYVADPDY
ncbi:hypothetical protein THASP1DRAFT_27992 [Thamnocephalis sphaerospora]|uniref:Brl1/Brr6 domain-containing protein n=1 Tax=Thamnocephalis sphaerospora TaxID=78915 RepID=A0A4P9XVE2_9FUNG|nr:hypothetical protein THASP1DRAFT_27992 [Thamnocephalis sphaerospora]|eukprot:RKP10226.1 hypothetical protein THASP1DRAFT_27992 [Thamnocephalis sphaerospora]